MARIKESIFGKVITPQKIEIIDAKHSKLIPGQKVLIYKSTGHKIISASGKIIGEKEKVLGFGEVKIIGDKLIVDSPKMLYTSPAYKAKSAGLGRVGLKSVAIARRKINEKTASSRTVLIKPIEE